MKQLFQLHIGIHFHYILNDIHTINPTFANILRKNNYNLIHKLLSNFMNVVCTYMFAAINDCHVTNIINF